MRRVTNTNLLFGVNFSKALRERFLQGNFPLRHLPPFMSWQWSAFNEVNDWAHNIVIYLSFSKDKNQTLLETLPDNHEQNDYDKICTHKVHFFESILDLARVHLEAQFRQTDLELVVQYDYCLNQFCYCYYWWWCCCYWNCWRHVQDVDFWQCLMMIFFLNLHWKSAKKNKYVSRKHTIFIQCLKKHIFIGSLCINKRVMLDEMFLRNASKFAK